MRSRKRGKSGWPRGPGGGVFAPSRREVLAGGIGAGALLALPDLSSGVSSDARPVVSGHPPARYAFVYGTPDLGEVPSGSLVAAMYPPPRAASTRPVPVATKLAAAPVSSPDQAVTALATVDMVHGGARITLTLLDATGATVARQGSVTVTGVPGDAHVLVTPVFARGSAIISLVLAITVPVGKHLVRKGHPQTGHPVPRLATTWRSHHALAYFDQRSGAMTGPFHLSDEPSLALSAR